MAFLIMLYLEISVSAAKGMSMGVKVHCSGENAKEHQESCLMQGGGNISDGTNPKK